MPTKSKTKKILNEYTSKLINCASNYGIVNNKFKDEESENKFINTVLNPLVEQIKNKTCTPEQLSTFAQNLLDLPENSARIKMLSDKINNIDSKLDSGSICPKNNSLFQNALLIVVIVILIILMFVIIFKKKINIF